MEHRLTWCSVWKQSQKAYRLMYRYIVYIYIHIYIYTYIYINIYIYIILSQLTALQGILSSAWKAPGIDSAAAHKDTAVPGAIPELSRSYPGAIPWKPL